MDALELPSDNGARWSTINPACGPCRPHSRPPHSGLAYFQQKSSHHAALRTLTENSRCCAPACVVSALDLDRPPACAAFPTIRGTARQLFLRRRTSVDVFGGWLPPR